MIAILGVLASILIPRLSTFFGTGEVAAANQEVAHCENAAKAYYVDHNSTWPVNTNTDLLQYINKPARVDYEYDQDGLVVPPAGATWGSTGLVWDNDERQWEKP